VIVDKRKNQPGRAHPDERFGETFRCHTEGCIMGSICRAIDDDAASFYRKYGFIELPEDKRKSP
jgi:hypothetical protein